MQAREKIEAAEHPLKIAALSANLAFSAVTENALDRSKIALVWEGADASRQVFSFFEIEQTSNRVANVLNDLGTIRGDRVFTLINRQPALYAAIPAILKTGAAAGDFVHRFRGGSDSAKNRRRGRENFDCRI